MIRTIRPYAPEDLVPMLNTWERANRLAHPFMTDAFIAQERYNIPNVYMPHAETWIIEQDGHVIGFLALIGNEVGGLFVDPAHHGTGAGFALMNKAKDLRGDLEVEVFKVNTIGRRFYDRYGFTLMHETMHEPTGQPVLRLRHQGIAT